MKQCFIFFITSLLSVDRLLLGLLSLKGKKIMHPTGKSAALVLLS